MEKNPTSSFKIGGIFGKKMFRKDLETSVIISLKKDNSLYFGEKSQKLFLLEKNRTWSFKIGGIFEKKKNEIPIGRRHFFETTSEVKCPEKPLANPEKPLANPEKLLANECGRRVYLTATPLPWPPRGEAEWWLYIWGYIEHGTALANMNGCKAFVNNPSIPIHYYGLKFKLISIAAVSVELSVELSVVLYRS